MVIVAGPITVDPQQRESYLAGCVSIVEQARRAAGYLDVAISANLIDPGRVNIFERWESQTALETFRGSGPSKGAAILSASVADAYDNAMAESFVSTLKRELIHRHSWPNRQVARTAIFEYIEGFYNTRRRHSALGHLSPSEYEEVRLRGGAVA